MTLGSFFSEIEKSDGSGTDTSAAILRGERGLLERYPINMVGCRNTFEGIIASSISSKLSVMSFALSFALTLSLILEF